MQFGSAKVKTMDSVYVSLIGAISEHFGDEIAWLRNELLGSDDLLVSDCFFVGAAQRDAVT